MEVAILEGMDWVHDFPLYHSQHLKYQLVHKACLIIAYNFPKTLLEATEREEKEWKTQNSNNNNTLTLSFSAFLLRRQELFHFCYLICPSLQLCEEIKADVINSILQPEKLKSRTDSSW